MIDRRSFLKSLFVLGIATQVPNIDKAIEQTLIDTVKMSDDEFVAYMTYSMNIYVSNPGQCMIITGIKAPE